MAKNSVASTVTLFTETQVRYEGELVSAGDRVIIFKAKKRGGQRFIQRSFPRSRVLAYGNDFIVVQQQAAVNSKVFRPINGQVEQDKSGFYVVDGVYVNPDFATVEADLGVEGGAKKAAPKKAPAKKKAA